MNCKSYEARTTLTDRESTCKGELAQPHRLPIGLLLALLAVVFAGCGRAATLNTSYGRSRGDGASSVNGLSVLAEMYSRAGYDVSAWSRLSPKLENEQVIVWAPDRFSVPATEEIEYLEKWLGSVSGRTLVYIGRDYDASIEYWSRLKQSQPKDRLGIRREEARAKSEHQQNRARRELEKSCSWFTLDTQRSPQIYESVSGPWADATTARPFRIRSQTQLVLPQSAPSDDDAAWNNELQYEPLIEVDNRVVAARAFRPSWQGSQLILVNNGSWLLNLPLTDSSHRQLAGQLIATCGPPNSVCFLEAGESPMTVTDRDTSLPLVLQAFTVWPFNLLALHLLMLGIVFCFSIFPIMGLPKPFREEHVSDFGKHVHALGELLERDRDVEYAENQIRMFREVVGVPVLGETGELRRGRVV